MSIWTRLFRKSHTAAPADKRAFAEATGKDVYVFEQGSRGWGVVMKKTWVEEKLRDVKLPATTRVMSDKTLIVMLAASCAQLSREQRAAHGKLVADGNDLVMEYAVGKSVTTPELPDDWAVPCYLVFLFRDLVLSRVFPGVNGEE